MTTSIASLSADRPSTDPAQDLFGHAPFARTLAKAIEGYLASDGIVLALYGPWGSGKSTVLAYVQHELEQGPPVDREHVRAHARHKKRSTGAGFSDAPAPAVRSALRW
jgi:hypothetical protein